MLELRLRNGDPLEETADVGCSVIRRNLLLHWYGQQRLTVGIWRDILEKWTEVLEQSVVENKSTPLLAAEGDGIVTLIFGQGLTSDGTWFKNVKDDLVGMRRI
jgi:hypothetical protein